MKSVILLIFFLFSFNLYCSIPSAEGLFRNGSNAEVTYNEIFLSFKVDTIGKDKPNSKFFKLYLNKNKGTFDLLKLSYHESQMNDMTINDATILENVKVAESDKETDDLLAKELLLASFDTIFFNSSNSFNKFLKKHNPNYKLNSELLNKDKLNLLYSYKEYLLKIEKNPGIEKDLASPLKPTDEKELENVNKIMKQDLYTQSESVFLEKSSDELFWKIVLKPFEALFTNEEHQLRKVSYGTDSSNTSIEFRDYQMLDGIHHTPKFITISTPSLNKYLITVIQFENKNIRLKNLVEKYRFLKNKKVEKIAFPMLF